MSVQEYFRSLQAEAKEQYLKKVLVGCNTLHIIRGQLEREYCNFVVWTPHGLHVECIHSQTAFFTDMSEKLEEYYIKISFQKCLWAVIR